MSMAISGSGVGSMPQVTSGASMSMAPSQKMSNLFQKMDSANTGSISQQQFTQAFNTMNTPAGFKAMGAAQVFGQLDPKGTGSVSKQDFVSGMSSLMSKARAHHHHAASAAAGQAGAIPGTSATTSAPSPTQSLSSSLQSLSAVNARSATASGGSTGALVNTVV